MNTPWNQKLRQRFDKVQALSVAQGDGGDRHGVLVWRRARTTRPAALFFNAASSATTLPPAVPSPA